MTFLEARVPPLLLAMLFGLLIRVIPDFKPLYGWFGSTALPISLVVLSIGLLFCMAGIFGFKKAKTTVNPTTPEKSSALVTTGVYQISRNPMYVGFLMAIIAWGIYQDNLLAIATGLLFVPYMNRFQIKMEESALQNLFGEQFIEYCQHVRRWL